MMDERELSEKITDLLKEYEASCKRNYTLQKDLALTERATSEYNFLAALVDMLHVSHDKVATKEALIMFIKDRMKLVQQNNISKIPHTWL
jgi:hypothetical protein